MNAARLARRWDGAGDDRLAMAEAPAVEMTTDLTKADLAALRADLTAEIQRMGRVLVMWFAGIMLAHYVAVLGGVVALVRLLA